MLLLSASDAWKAKYPGAVVGMMVIGDIENIKNNAFLAAEKSGLEGILRQQISSKKDILEHPIIRAYIAYYKKFRKSYHVLLQIESVALKGRSIPNVNAVVSAMFMAELKNCLLTAGHDLESIAGPVLLDISKGDELYIKINSEQQVLKAGDMMVTDNRGVLSSVIYGPDKRSRITVKTKNALFVVYAPSGVPEEKVSDHLGDIFKYIQLFSPLSKISLLEIFNANVG
ncbi:MAG: phenylalanine--tRNA ligase beta subunit-related protein [Pelolinea sp.]|nr:phenylalanine--tRNA ligase beta subunit-related protein [Pelolinea sp.]